MIRNLLLSASRSLLKNKFFTSLNILGLAIGMAVFMLISQYVHFERSYENFIQDASLIYRVKLESYINNELVFASAENYPGAGPALKIELPEVTDYARLYNLGYKNNVIITNEDASPEPIAFKLRKFLYADSSFLPMMGYRMQSGDARQVLAEPNTAVLSARYAKMYFGQSDPIGKMLRMQDDDFNNELVKVTGVFEDLPENTHLKFDILFSYKTLFGRRPDRGDWAVKRYDQSWARKDMYVFIKVRPGSQPEDLEAKFPAVVDKYNPGLKEKNQRDILSLQPLKDIHLTSRLVEEPEPNGDATIVKFLFLIGIFVLVIAWINYINLATAKAMERAKEVGVRKVMGALKSQLVYQFLTEASVVNLISILLAAGIVALVLPFFNSLSGLSLDLSYLVQPWFLAMTASIWLGGTILSGFYPALVLSSFRPVTILKGKLKNSLQGIILRKTLVVFQFMCSVALIAGTLIVFKQLNFLMNQDLGLNIEQIMVVERPGIAPRDRKAFNSSIDVFRDELQKGPGIESVSASGTVPGHQREFKAATKKYGAPDDQLVTLLVNGMDYRFLDVFKMNVVAGRGFSEEFPKDQDTSVLVTVTAARQLGFAKPEDAVGQTVSIPNFEWSPIIVGVVNDYHQVSLKHPITPTIFYCSKYGGEYYSIRINTSDLGSTVEHVRNSWQKAFPGNPFDYFFLDDYFNRQYENEQKFGKLFTTFAGLAVIVGCLGLFGLSAYTATQRTKEIGIRKVLGSSERAIFMLLSREYLKLVGLAIVLAIPLIYFVMNSWIQEFPYRTSIGVTVFLVAGAAVLLLSQATVSLQTLRAAKTNPVDSLRHE